MRSLPVWHAYICQTVSRITGKAWIDTIFPWYVDSRNMMANNTGIANWNLRCTSLYQKYFQALTVLYPRLHHPSLWCICFVAWRGYCRLSGTARVSVCKILVVRMLETSQGQQPRLSKTSSHNAWDLPKMSAWDPVKHLYWTILFVMARVYICHFFALHLAAGHRSPSARNLRGTRLRCRKTPHSWITQATQWVVWYRHFRGRCI